MKIEPFTESDIPELVKMYKAAHQESRYRDWPFSEEMAIQALKDSMKSFGIKVTKEGVICGCWMAFVTNLVFSPRPIGLELAFWIKPEYRGTRAFLLLLKCYEKWCKDNLLYPIVNLHFSEDNSQMAKMLGKIGFRQFGAVFTKEV